jgi:hypothetical protein
VTRVAVPKVGTVTERKGEVQAALMQIICHAPNTAKRDQVPLRRVAHVHMRAKQVALGNSGADNERVPFRRALSAVAAWLLLVVALLVTTLSLGWIILGFLFLGSGPSGDAQPVSTIILALLAISGALAWFTARHTASWRPVCMTVAIIVTLVALIGGTWTLSAPIQALYLARDIVWDGTNIEDYRKYSQRTTMRRRPFNSDKPHPQTFFEPSSTGRAVS